MLQDSRSVILFIRATPSRSVIDDDGDDDGDDDAVHDLTLP